MCRRRFYAADVKSASKSSVDYIFRATSSRSPSAGLWWGGGELSWPRREHAQTSRALTAALRWNITIIISSTGDSYEENFKSKQTQTMMLNKTKILRLMHIKKEAINKINHN